MPSLRAASAAVPGSLSDAALVTSCVCSSLSCVELDALGVRAPPGVEEADHRADVGEQDREQHQDEEHAPEPVPVDAARRPLPGPAGAVPPGSARAHAPWVRRRRALPSCKGRSSRVGRPGLAELLLDPQQLVVLRRPIRARRGAGLDLPGAGRDRQVGDRGVLGLARAVRDDGRVAGLVGDRDRLQRLGQRPDLVQLDQDRVGDARARSRAAGARGWSRRGRRRRAGSRRRPAR